MNKLWRNVRTTIAEACRNTPVEVLLTIVCGLLASLQLSDYAALGDEKFVMILLTAFLGLCAIFATSAGHALKVFDGRTRWVLTGMFAAGLAAYGGLVLDVSHTTELWRWSFLGVAAVMGVMLVPVAARIGDVSASERFWRYNIRLLSRVGLAYGYGLVMYLGLAVGLAAIDGLFDLSIDSDVYAHTFTWVAGVLSTILAVGSLAEVKRIGEPFTPHTLVWSGRLGSFLFMPLVLLYLGIMYVYLVKVVTTGELPSNILSPLALGAGMLGYFGLFVLQPHMHREDFKPLAKLLRAFPAAFIPIVPFGVFAVWQRVAQYGWTEFRYARMAALICLGIFSVIGAYKWLRKQEFSLVTGPAILGLVAVVGAVGPWGASNVSETSQLNRLTTALAKGNLLEPNGQMVSKERMVAAVHQLERETISTAALYLVESHGDEALAGLSPVALADFHETWETLGALGITPESAIMTMSVSADPNTPFHFERGGFITEFGVSVHHPTTTRGVDFTLDGMALVVSYREVTGRAQLHFDGIDRPFETYSQAMPTSERQVPLIDASGEVVGSVALRDATLEYQRDTAAVAATYVSGIVVVY